MAMDALQGKVDSVDNQVRQIATELRGYLDHGITSSRKVKPPGTKAGRVLLEQLLGRIDQIVSTDLADVRRLSLSSSNPPSPLPQTRTANAPDTPSISDSPGPAQITQTPAVPQDGSPQLQLEPVPTISLADTSATTTLTATAVRDDSINAHEGLTQQSSQHLHQSPTTVTLKPDLVTPVTPVTPGRGPSGVPSDVSRDVSLPLTYSGPQLPCPVVCPRSPTLFEHSAPLFDCVYQDIHILNEDLFEQCSSHPIVRNRGYFKLQVRNLPPLNVERMDKPTRDHAQSFYYKADEYGIIKVDHGKKPRFSQPALPFPSSAKLDWSLEEQRDLWNSSAQNPPKGHRPYIIGNPLFEDVELSPGEKLRQRGPGPLEGINTQYVYFNLTGKTITTMHREDAHVRSENLLRSGENKFWCFVKPSSTAKLEESMRRAYPGMQPCSQAVRHLSRHIPPAVLDEWGVEYTLDYCVPGQAVVTEPGTYHQVLNLGPNYAVAINLEYMSSPDMPVDYRFCDKSCPDKFAITAKDFEIYRGPTPPEEEPVQRKKSAMGPSENEPVPKKKSAMGPLEAEPAPRKKSAMGPPSPTTESTPEQSALNRQKTSPTQNAEETHDGQQQQDPIGAAAGPTPTLTPERENQEAEPETQRASQPQVSTENVTDAPGSEARPLPAADPSTDTSMSSTPVLGQPIQTMEDAQPQPQLENRTYPLQSGEHLARNDLAYTPGVTQLAPRPYSPTRMNIHSPSLLQQRIPPIIPFAATQPLLQVPILPQSGFPYTPKILVPKQLIEEPAKTQERYGTEVPPLPACLRIEQMDRQFRPPPQHYTTQSPPVQAGSPHAHTLREFSLRPTPQADSIQPELRSDSVANLNLTPVSNTIDFTGKRRKRQADAIPTKKPQKRQRVEPTPSDDLFQRSSFNNIANLLRGCSVGQGDALLTGQICSKASFDRLAGIVKDYRDYTKPFNFVGGGLNLVNHVDASFQGSLNLHVYLSRFSKMKLAELTENAKERDFSQGATEEVYTDRLLSELKWDESERHKLHDYVREGKCWMAICGRYEGVLCLMPPDIPDSYFTELALFHNRIAAIHSQVNLPYVQKLCEMGKVLEKAMWSDLELPEFTWEAVDTSVLTLDQVYHLLARFQSVKSNQFDPEKYHWSKPLCWTWNNWPTDPTSLGSRDKKFCDQCKVTTARGKRSSCRCYENQVPSIPRVSDDGSKGPGVRAVGMYQAGSLLGELVGELVPLGTFRSTADWTLQFRRPDLDDEPVAEIYTRYVGNWVRKVNHCSAQPSAEFKVMKISGRWRQMLVALRDINDGEEITAKYGKGFRKEQPYSIVEGFY